MTQRHEMAILRAPPAMFASAAFFIAGITGCACAEKWYAWNRLAGFPHGSAEMCDYSLSIGLAEKSVQPQNSDFSALLRLPRTKPKLSPSLPARHWLGLFVWKQ